MSDCKKYLAAASTRKHKRPIRIRLKRSQQVTYVKS